MNTNNDSFSRNASGITKPSSTGFDSVIQSEHDDIELINASNYIRICSIGIYAKEYVNALFIKYKLPSGQFIESLHSTKEVADYYDNQTLDLTEDENINQITWAFTTDGVTRLGFTTTKNRKIIVEGGKISDDQKAYDINLADENKILIGFKSNFSLLCLNELSWYTTSVNTTKLESLLVETMNKLSSKAGLSKLMKERLTTPYSDQTPMNKKQKIMENWESQVRRQSIPYLDEFKLSIIKEEES